MKSNFKNDFPIFQNFLKGSLFRKRGSKSALGAARLIYLDSGATSQKPRSVIEAEKEWYEQLNANVHRSAYALAEAATAAYEEGRDAVANFIHARKRGSTSAPSEIIFTKGATEAINLVAYSWARHNLKKGDVILLTEMEHHANIVPWQILREEMGIELRFWPIDEKGKLIIESRRGTKFCAPTGLFDNVKFLSLTHISNVLGTLNPIEKIIPLAHQKGIKVLVDAAQSVPHMPIDVQKLKPDFLVFSSHKMLGPTGLGILYAAKERHAEMHAFHGGGEMIEKVTFEGSTFKPVPWKFEAGTQPLAQIYGLTAAIKYLNKIGMKTIQKQTQQLTQHAFQELSAIPEVTIIGPPCHPEPVERATRGPLLSFTVKDLHPHDLATFLDQDGIAIRAGHHCAQPLHDLLKIPASARISFHIYNEKKDVDEFIKSLKRIIKEWNLRIP